MVIPFDGFIRRIDFEPKLDFLGYRTYAHVFVKNTAEEIDVYTDDPRLEAAVLAVFDPHIPMPTIVRVFYEEVENAKKLVRVILDRDPLPRTRVKKK